jgi:hypothetical protein
MESSIMLIVIVLTSIMTGTGETQHPETYFIRGQTLDSCYKSAKLLTDKPYLIGNRTVIGTVCIDASGTSGMSQLKDFSIENEIQSKINKRSY